MYRTKTLQSNVRHRHWNETAPRKGQGVERKEKDGAKESKKI